MHQEYLKAFVDKAASDVRVLGTWIEGSFAKGTADRYSQISTFIYWSPKRIKKLSNRNRNLGYPIFSRWFSSERYFPDR